MFSTSFLAAATMALSLVTPSFALYDPESNANLAMYWGAGSNQQSLLSFCEETTLDIIPLAFINKFPPQANGWVEMNFGNHACYPTVYDTNPGYGEDSSGNPVITEGNNLLSNACPELQRDIPLCQAMGKKIVISLGGAWDAMNNDYFIFGPRDAYQLANFLWDAFGPYKEGYTGVRPLDRGYSNTSDTHIDIDGFDFDIEYIPQGMHDIGDTYTYVIEELRRLMDLEASRKKYLITGAPMCSVVPLDFNYNPSPTMEATILSSTFDALFIQFYNNNCAANGTGFNIQTWVDTLAETANANTKLYIGLPASPGSVGSPQYSGNYLEPLEAKALIQTYQNTIPNFGGVMLWEATGALNNIVTPNEVPGIPCNTTYYQFIKQYALEGLPLPTTTATACVSSTVSSTSSSIVTSTTTSSSSTFTPTSTTTSSSSTSSDSSTTTSTSSSTVSSTTSSSTSATDSSTSSISSSATETTSSSSTTETTTDVPTSTPSISTTSSYTNTSSTTISTTSTAYGNGTTTTRTLSTSSSSSTSAPYGNSTTTRGTLSTSSTSLTSSVSPTSKPGGVTSTSGTHPTLSGTTKSTSVRSTSTPGTLPTLSGTPTSFPGGVTSSSGTVPTGTPSSGPSGGVASSSTSSKVQYTTSTVRTTSVITVTSCAPEVTNCPNGPHVTTIIVDVSTTICPVTETEVPHSGTVPVFQPTISDKIPHPTGVHTPTGPGEHVPAPSSVPGKPTPEKPSTEQPSTEKPSGENPTSEKPSPENPSPEKPSAPVPTSKPAGSNPVHVGVPGGDEDSNSSIEETSTKTKYFTATQFTTLVHSGATKTIGLPPASTVTVVPVPYPTPGESKPAGSAAGSGVVVPSSVTYSTLTLPTSVSGGEVTSTPVAPIKTPLPFEGAGSKIGSGSLTTLMALVLAVVMVLM